MTLKRARARRTLAPLVAFGLLLSVLMTGGGAPEAQAADYPSWNDVQAARNDEAAKKTQIAELEALLRQLEDQVAAAQAEAEHKGQLYYEAQLVYDEAAYRAQLLQQQADEAAAEAEQSMRKAGQLAARLQRASGDDLTANLLFSEDGGGNLLAQLGMATKVNQQSNSVYAKAKQDQNTAQALTDQADVAKAALGELAAAAEAAMREAQTAADAAAAALQEQEEHRARLQAQLATLVENREATEAEYIKGIEAAWGEGAGNAPGPISPSGWIRPSGGSANVSSFGPRIPPFPGASSYHNGTDWGAGCGTNIYAAHNGTVDYAGWNGGYGNFVRINHGDGLTTGYAHIQTGGTLVQNGQPVVVGQVIARTGTTGTSNGCHLHFEVRRHGNPVNPVLFLRGEGVSI